MTIAGNLDANHVRPRPYLNAAIVGTSVIVTGAISVLAQETIASLTGSLVPLPDLALTIGASLLFGSNWHEVPQSLLHRFQVNPTAVWVGGITAVVMTHRVAVEAGYPVIGYASGALLGGLVAEKWNSIQIVRMT
jgi:hypothetical protein